MTNGFGHAVRAAACAAAFAACVTVAGSSKAGADSRTDSRADDSGAPIAWIARAAACATPFTWVRSPLVPFNRRPAWRKGTFLDTEGSYTRYTQGDPVAGRTTGPTINLVEGQSGIFNDWVAFPRDPKTGRILFYGGGHGGYAGGDVYLWDVASDAFDLVFEPRRLKFRGLDPDNPEIELWLPSDGAPTGPHTYGVALWHSSGKVLWGRGGAAYGYVKSDDTWQKIRTIRPEQTSRLKLFDTRDLKPGRGDPERWSWGPDIRQVISAAPAAVELPDGRVLFIDEELRVSYYDVAANKMGLKAVPMGSSGRVGAAFAVYSPFDDKVYVRNAGGVWRLDYHRLTVRQLAAPKELPERRAGYGAYRRHWYDRSGLVVAGSRLFVIGGYSDEARRDPSRFGHIYFYDLAADNQITWLASDGPDLWSVHGKSWYLAREGVIMSLPAHDQPPWLMVVPATGSSPHPAQSSQSESQSNCSQAVR